MVLDFLKNLSGTDAQQSAERFVRGAGDDTGTKHPQIVSRLAGDETGSNAPPLRPRPHSD
jgi:hypothetical protein